MNRKFGVFCWCVGCLATVVPGRAGETNAPGARVGVYDSRVVAFAWFNSEAQMAKLKEEMTAAQAAKTAGDEAKSKELAAALRAKQDQIHREAFSTAPADEALAELKARLPEIEKAAGVTTVVSKWDDAALKKYEGAEKVDVTDALAQAFGTPTEKQSKSLEAIKKSKPLPLDECNKLIREGKL